MGCEGVYVVEGADRLFIWLGSVKGVFDSSSFCAFC